jgi:DNA-binding CsgD family transcriptional regulator
MAGAEMDDFFSLCGASAQVSSVNYTLECGTFQLGRSSKCDLVLAHHTVSRRHAEFVVTAKKVTVCDLGSRNGTFVNGERIGTAHLIKGDRIQFGGICFSVARTGLDGGFSDSEVETAKCKPAHARHDYDFGKLSNAQRRVLKMLLQGLAEKQVACQLSLSTRTIHNHTQAIYRIFKVHSRPELLACLLGQDGKVGMLLDV